MQQSSIDAIVSEFRFKTGIDIDPKISILPRDEFLKDMITSSDRYLKRLFAWYGRLLFPMIKKNLFKVARDAPLLVMGIYKTGSREIVVVDFSTLRPVDISNANQSDLEYSQKKCMYHELGHYVEAEFGLFQRFFRGVLQGDPLYITGSDFSERIMAEGIAEMIAIYMMAPEGVRDFRDLAHVSSKLRTVYRKAQKKELGTAFNVIVECELALGKPRTAELLRKRGIDVRPLSLIGRMSDQRYYIHKVCMHTGVYHLLGRVADLRSSDIASQIRELSDIPKMKVLIE